MLIEFLQPWRRAVPGQRIEFHTGAARVLIRRGKAKAVEPTSKHVARRQKRKALAHGE